MLVSVIIPNYNHANYLKQRLDSVLEQRFNDYEVIILDDCSTDNSREIIEQYREHPKVSNIVYNKINSGNTFKQWKSGLELAKGEWIWIAESDDWCEPTFLNEVLPIDAAEYNEIVLSFCGSIMIRDNNIVSYPSIKYFDSVLDGFHFITTSLVKENLIQNASMCIFRGDCIKELNNIFKYNFCGDWFLWTTIASLGKVKVNGKCLNYFRKHEVDVSSRRFKDGTYHLEFVNIQKYLLLKNYIDINVFKNCIYEKFKLIRKIVDPQYVVEVENIYKDILGLYFVKVKFKKSLYSRWKYLIKLFSFED